MASSNIKLFDENKGNMLSDSEFNSSTQRMNGLQAGVASSKLQNKAMYQASLVAYAIAQVMMQNGKNANDTDAVSAFVANLSGAMLQKVYDLATTSEAQAGTATGKWMSPALVKAAFDYRKATTSEAQAGTNNTKWMSPALVKAEIDKILSDKNFLQKSGGTMTGNLVLNANPTANLGAATKQYVDTQVNNVVNSKVPEILLEQEVSSTAANSTYTFTLTKSISNFKRIIVLLTGCYNKSNTYVTASTFRFGSTDQGIRVYGNKPSEVPAFARIELVKSSDNSFNGYYCAIYHDYQSDEYLGKGVRVEASDASNKLYLVVGDDASRTIYKFKLTVIGHNI